MSHREEPGLSRHPQVLVTVLTYRRPAYLARTLDSIESHLFDPECCRVRIFVNAEDPETMAVIEARRHLFETVLTSPVNLMQGPALDALWKETGTPWVLHVEDDFPVLASGWLPDAIEWMERNPEVGQLRLQPWEDFYVMKTHVITKEECRLGPGEPVSGGAIHRIEPSIHFTFCPSLMPSRVVEAIRPFPADRVKDEAENFAQARFHATGMATAQRLPPVFAHEGRHSAFGGWGVGFGLHPTTTRLGIAWRALRLGVVKAIKAVLGPDLSGRLKRLLGIGEDRD